MRGRLGPEHPHPIATGRVEIRHDSQVDADGGVRVVGLGAWCDFVTEADYRSRFPGFESSPAVDEAIEEFKRGASFDVHEFAVLDDGRRITLHDQRGFTTAVRVSDGSTPGDTWQHLTLAELERDVLTTVLPDDDETQDEHPWEWLAGLLRDYGVEASADELRALPYEVVFSDRLRARVADA
jgi:hypothetical protein